MFIAPFSYYNNINNINNNDTNNNDNCNDNSNNNNNGSNNNDKNNNNNNDDDNNKNNNNNDNNNDNSDHVKLVIHCGIIKSNSLLFNLIGINRFSSGSIICWSEITLTCVR